MADSFHCPKCNASYPRDQRRVGKAVVCACGHRFLVPPLDYAAPPSSTPSNASVTPRPRRATPAPERAKRIKPRARPASSSDSSSEVLPLAEPVEPAAPGVGARWADPVEAPQPAPLMEAEVIQPATPYAEPVDLAGNLFTPSGPYVDPFTGGQPPQGTAARKRGRARGGERSMSFSTWVAYAVLFFFLPASALFTVIGLLQPEPRAGQTAGPQTQPGADFSVSTPAATEPPQSGYPITLWNAHRSSSGEFSVDYRQDRGPLDRSRQYFWVVSDLTGKIEFPLPPDVLKHRDRLSGKPGVSAAGQFTGPYTTYIEEQAGTSRNRISNDVQVVAVP